MGESFVELIVHTWPCVLGSKFFGKDPEDPTARTLSILDGLDLERLELQDRRLAQSELPSSICLMESSSEDELARLGDYATRS